MKPNPTSLLRRRKWFRAIFGLFSLSGIMFAFQACYGTPQDFGMDILISGTVLSGTTNAGIQGIVVSFKDQPNYSTTNENGNFSLYTERRSEYLLNFSDIDGDANGAFASKDTVIVIPENQRSARFTIHLD